MTKNTLSIEVVGRRAVNFHVQSTPIFQSFWPFYSASSSPLLIRGAPDYSTDTVSIGVSCRSAQATAGKGLAQGPYVAVRARVEPTTLQLKVIDSMKAPTRPNLIKNRYRADCLKSTALVA